MTVPGPDIFMNLQKKIVEAAVAAWEGHRGFGLTDICTSFTEGDFLPPIYFYLVINQNRWNALPPDLQKVIEEAEGLCLTACDDCDSRTYLIYQPRYPWALTQADRDLTEEHLAAMFGRYVGMLTDEVVDVDYQEVENGG